MGESYSVLAKGVKHLATEDPATGEYIKEGRTDG